ncbi:membrane-flanked domain-containing protein [Streptomyces viridochromogenes DSM 40736]|uniref:Membrane-flanked domain-containing protein n=1 Tax=Streptomyces viridochromogenes (strain DSM 40736 / JCM 4977 / BCRC 1201 / Tue 494) TaxID=591159 RepID=D9X5C8_STRVT|nr:membrane-flanked domain-containing protein [Streptomyces viridochromogenes DSM 40736]
MTTAAAAGVTKTTGTTDTRTTETTGPTTEPAGTAEHAGTPAEPAGTAGPAGTAAETGTTTVETGTTTVETGTTTVETGTTAAETGTTAVETRSTEPAGTAARAGEGSEAVVEVVERRLHPVTPLRRAWAPVAVLFGWAVHDPDGAQRHLSRLTTTTLLIGLAVIVPAAALYGFCSWWFTHFAVTESELRIRTGLVFRRTAHIRLERIQAIDVTQPLLARVAGVAKLKLDVIGTDKKDELAFLGADEARALRAELLARAAGFAPGTAHEVGEAPSRQLLRVPPGVLAVSLVLSGATWGSLAAALVVPPLLWLATQSVWTLLAVALPLLGAAGASSVGRFVAEYDWTVAESPDGLRIDHGLLDRAHETVPPGRVQSVRIVEPLLWRRRGWVRVELDVSGSANSLLIPVAPRELAEAVVARVLPGVTVPQHAALSPSPRRARWCVPLWWRGYGLAVTDTVFVARSGLLCRTLSLVPHAKVQSVRMTQGPWERARGVADVSVDTGADQTVRARLRDAAEARDLLAAQAERSRTGRRDARPDRWMA